MFTNTFIPTLGAKILVTQGTRMEWVKVAPLSKNTGKNIVSILKELVMYWWGVTREFFTPNETEFRNNDLESLLEEMHMKLSTAPLYYPQAN